MLQYQIFNLSQQNNTNQYKKSFLHNDFLIHNNSPTCINNQQKYKVITHLCKHFYYLNNMQFLIFKKNGQ